MFRVGYFCQIFPSVAFSDRLGKPSMLKSENVWAKLKLFFRVLPQNVLPSFEAVTA